MSILFTIRTADRSPKPNYLGLTLESLLAAGMAAEHVHLVPTDPDVRWLEKQIPYGMRAVHVHRPSAWRKPNANALAQIDLLQESPADWIVMTEDDLEWCARPIDSIEAWLTRYETPLHMVYRFFAFGPITPLDRHSGTSPLVEQRGSQAVALRAANAIAFAAWARQHAHTWRPPGAPFQDRPHDGFDKLIGYWAIAADPAVRVGLVSRPFFVRHLGRASSIHAHGVGRDALFAGRSWRFPPEAMQQ